MRRLLSKLRVLCSFIIFSACNTVVAPETGSAEAFEMVFDVNNQDALDPIETWGYDGPFGSRLSRKALEAYFETDEGARELESKRSTDGGRSVDFAVVFNDDRFLEDVQVDGTVYAWPEIDFSKYSLLVDVLYFPTGGLCIRKQRAILEERNVVLYMEIGAPENAFITCAPTQAYFAALYPKLPSGPVTIYRRNTDID